MLSSPAAPPIRFEQFDLGPVQVEGDLGGRIDLAVRKNFLALDLEKDFLGPFRHRKPKEEAKSQQDRFRGLGLQISAAVSYARYTSDPQVIVRKNRLVSETIRTQSPSGYIGLFQEERDAAQLWQEWSFHDAAYIVLGLAEDYRYYRHQASLDAARRLAGYLMTNWTRRPKEPDFTSLGTAEAFFMLYDLTRDEKYLRFAADEPMGKRYRIVPAPLIQWEQDLYPARKVGAEAPAAQPKAARLDSCHMYRIFERAMMQLRLNRIEPRQNLPLMSRRIAAAMTRREKPGLLITGGTGQREGWHETQDGSGRVAETCATVYGLWMLDEMARHDGDLRYGDIMERILFNALLAAQDPAGRRIRYFTPFSGKREYFEHDAFCCPNNFRRGMASLPKLIYYRAGGGAAVQLYTSSTARLDLGEGVSLEIRQETAYPASGRVDLKLRPSAPAKFPLRLRIPRWCSQAAVAVNGGVAAKVPAGQPFHEIERVWRAGDAVRLEMPLRARFVKGRESQRGRAALMRGPVLYCLNPQRNPGTEGIDLREITLDPDSLEGPFPDASARPSGLAIRVRGWSPARKPGDPADLTLLLTEFPDPGGEEIYFRLAKPAVAVDDELTL